MSPWWLLLGLLSWYPVLKSSHCSSFEDQAPIEFIYRGPILTHCGLVAPYGNMELGQHWLRLWLVAWRHQAITWTNVDLSSVMSLGIHLRALSLDNVKKPINKTRLKIAPLKWHPGLPGANELKWAEETCQHHKVLKQNPQQWLTATHPILQGVHILYNMII